jgi:probable DNA metabolism protein
MHQRATVTYLYDGSFEGFLSCVFEAYYAKDDVAGICDENGTAQGMLFGSKNIPTDPEKAGRVWRSVRDKISAEACSLVSLGFLSCAGDREMMLLDFLREGFRRGANVTRMLTLDPVDRLQKAVRYLNNETHKYKGFVRFSEIGGALYAVIEPNNHVLPLLSGHFCDRLRNEAFVIYDKNRALALIYQKGQSVLAPVENWEPPSPGRTELEYQRMWKRFYDTIAIRERDNPTCRRGHMPKRYWGCLTEFTFREDKFAQEPRDESGERAEPRLLTENPQ